jgi:hypothetical protein
MPILRATCTSVIIQCNEEKRKQSQEKLNANDKGDLFILHTLCLSMKNPCNPQRNKQ